MNRREMLASVLGVPGVGGVKPVAGGTRAIILTLHPDVQFGEDVVWAKEEIKAAFAEAGIGDIPVVFLAGVQAEVVT
jgi:hypothetical protein